MRFTFTLQNWIKEINSAFPLGVHEAFSGVHSQGTFDLVYLNLFTAHELQLANSSLVHFSSCGVNKPQCI